MYSRFTRALVIDETRAMLLLALGRPPSLLSDRLGKGKSVRIRRGRAAVMDDSSDHDVTAVSLSNGGKTIGRCPKPEDLS